MANRRMFSNGVIDSDEFISLSIPAQALYFHLGLKADDDGFVSTKRILKILGLDSSLLAELEDAGFIICFDGPVVISHWQLNNELKKDRYHETQFQGLKKRLSVDEDKVYHLMEPDWNQDGNSTEPGCNPQYSPG